MNIAEMLEELVRNRVEAECNAIERAARVFPLKHLNVFTGEAIMCKDKRVLLALYFLSHNHSSGSALFRDSLVTEMQECYDEFLDELREAERRKIVFGIGSLKGLGDGKFYVDERS